MRKITKQTIENFKNYLISAEKSSATVEKYIRDITAFVSWTHSSVLNKSLVLEYKQHIIGSYAPASVNSMLSSINSFFNFNEWHDLRIKSLKIQKQIFLSKDKELTKEEYERLCKTALKKRNEPLYLLMQTICASGIRVSELRAVTVEAVKSRQAVINCKGKMRTIILPNTLCTALMKYIREQKIKNGAVFVTRNGKPLDRSNIWRAMKNLCREAGVSENKVFPHNLRHLFARTYYSIQKDIARLADILGHSSVHTTRIYIMENSDIHRRQLQELGLLLC